MAFFNKILAGTNNIIGRFQGNGDESVVKKSAPMRKLSIIVEDEKSSVDEVKKAEAEKVEEKSKSQPILNPKKGVKNKNNDIVAKKRSETCDETSDPLLRLKALAEKVRNRVHYIDKNDFAKKAVSSKDKVYDFDLRKDLAYFLANDEFLREVEEGIRAEKNEDDFQKFEELILQAANNEEIGYVVYGERTYILEGISQNDVKPSESVKKTNQSENKPLESKVAGLSKEVVEVFRKNAETFAENFKSELESEIGKVITKEEASVLIRIFTKRFLREMILEKETTMMEKMSFDPTQSQRLVEYICSSIFK